MGDDVGDALGIEGKHVVSGEFMLEQDVGVLAVDLADVGGHQGDVLHGEVDQAAEVGEVTYGRHLGTDDDVGSHGPGDIYREVVAGAAVTQDHALDAYRAEIAGYGHGGAHGGDDIA